MLATATAKAPDKEKRDYIALRRYVDGRLKGLRADRETFVPHWRELSTYILPRRGRYLITSNAPKRGSAINQSIIDNTGTMASRTLASGMMAGITSPARPWFKLTLGDEEVAEKSPVKLWLDEVQKRVMRVFAKSNFYNAVAVMYEELGIFGTAAMLIYEDFEDVIRCYPLTVGEYFLVIDHRNAVVGLYREFVKTVQQVVEEFIRQPDGSLDWTHASVGLKQAYEQAKQPGTMSAAALDKEITIAHAIEFNTEREPDAKGLKGMQYRDVYWELGSSENCMLKVRGFNESPICAPRWHVIGNDAYGRSPGMDILGDVKALQVLQKRKAQGIDKMVNPPLIADAVLKNEPATVLPGGVTYLANPNGVGFKPVYQVSPNVREMVMDIQDHRERINKGMYTDLFLMISQLETVRTATEIVERKEEKLIMLGPVLERVHDEMLTPAVERVFNIMMRAGLLPPAPPELQGVEIQIEYISMLAQAQKAVATAGVEKLVGFAGNLAAVNPNVLDKVDFDAAIDEYGTMLGVSPKIIIPQEKVDAARQERARQAQAQRAMEQGMAAVQGAKVLSETPVGRGGTALDQIMGNA